MRLLLYSAITPKSEDKYVVKVFNSTELHFSEVYFFQNWYFIKVSVKHKQNDIALSHSWLPYPDLWFRRYDLFLSPSIPQSQFNSRLSSSLCSIQPIYRKVASSNTSHLEAHAGFFRLLMKGIFNPYVLWPFGKKIDFLISNMR